MNSFSLYYIMMNEKSYDFSICIIGYEMHTHVTKTLSSHHLSSFASLFFASKANKPPIVHQWYPYKTITLKKQTFIVR